jgi:hypothetical protein
MGSAWAWYIDDTINRSFWKRHERWLWWHSRYTGYLKKSDLLQENFSYVKLCPYNPFFMAQQPIVGQSIPIIEVLRSHSGTPHSVGLIWTWDQPNTETSTWQHTTQQRHIHDPAGFKPAIPASEWPQTHALDRVASPIGITKHTYKLLRRYEARKMCAGPSLSWQTSQAIRRRVHVM